VVVASVVLAGLLMLVVPHLGRP